MSEFGVTVTFAVALAATTIVQIWLASRQLGHLARHRDRVPARFSDEISLADHQRAIAYGIENTRLGMIDLVFGALVLLGWTLGGGLAWLDVFWRTYQFGTLGTGLAVLLSVLLINGALAVPMNAWQTFVTEKRFGFNRTTPMLFIRDLVVGTLLMLALGTPLVALLLWLIDALGDRWWIAGALVWIAFTLLMTWLYPAVIAPLFNRFRGLDDADLAARLGELLQRCGFRDRGVKVMDGSRRSAHGNAFFTGFGRNKRIVLFDTLLERLEGDEIEAVLAHELGHFRLHHVTRRLLGIAGLAVALFALAAYLIESPAFQRGLGVELPSQYLGLVLFILVAPVAMVLLQPLFSWLSRRDEFAADAFAARHARARSLINALVKLYRDNASSLTVDPLYSAFHHSHPPASQRIDRLAGLESA
ncbi:MAG: M48 family metallopeptidase [Chromatiales bacterium]|nr:M48 family metallopeptidase [Chromatiales bacterium]